MTLPAQAHEGPPRLELTTDRIPPGATLEVRGINLGADLSVTVWLSGAGREVQLGEVIGDAHGDFLRGFALPADLLTGAYVVRAVSSDGTIADAPLNIEGAPIFAGEEERGQRDRWEPLLAPMPARAAQVASANPSAARPPAEAEPVLPTRLVLSSSLAIVLLVGGLLIHWRRSR